MSDRVSTLETPVLIAGGGPIGLALAANLGRLGVGTMLVEERENRLNPAKMLEVSVRTMEFCRQIGIAGKILRPIQTTDDEIHRCSRLGYD